jgi:hypothetical protein
MSLDVYLESDEGWTIYDANITHNLGKMAKAAGIYRTLWRPDDVGVRKARDIIAPLREGLNRLKASPEHFKTYNATNGWGLYKHFVPFVEQYLAACEGNPDANVRVSR